MLVIGTQRHGGDLPDRERIDGFDLWRVRYGAYGAGLRRPWRWLRHALQAAQIIGCCAACERAPTTRTICPRCW